MDEDRDIQECAEAFALAFKRKNPPIRGPLRKLIGILSPILVKSPDARIKALGIALAAAAATFLRKKKE